MGEEVLLEIGVAPGPAKKTRHAGFFQRTEFSYIDPLPYGLNWCWNQTACCGGHMGLLDSSRAALLAQASCRNPISFYCRFRLEAIPEIRLVCLLLPFPIPKSGIKVELSKICNQSKNRTWDSCCFSAVFARL